MNRTFLLLTGLLLLTAALLFFGRRTSTVTIIPVVPENTIPTDEAPAPTPAISPARAALYSRSFIPRARASINGETNAPAEWELKIEAALTAEGTDAELSARLLELYPELPGEAQAEVAPHLAALTPDAEYHQIVNLLTNAATPEAVADVLLTDLLDRPAATRLNTLLTVASTPDHPKAEDAKDLLAALMEQDHGQDWALWTKKISEWLASHPE